MTTIDFGKALRDAKSASYEALPSGDYDVEVAQADSVRASSGKPMIKAQLKVLVGPYQDRRVFNNFVLSLENPQAMAIWFRHMRSFGLTDDFFAALGGSGGLEPVATALVGRRARITLGQRDWQGETRNEVNAVKPYTGAPGLGGPTPPPPTTGPIAAGPAPLAPPPPASSTPPPPSQPTYGYQTSTPVAAAPVAPQPPPPPSQVSAQLVPIVEAAPFDGTPGPVLAVPTDGGSTASVPSPVTPTQPTSEVPPLVTPPPQPQPPVAPELPI